MAPAVGVYADLFQVDIMCIIGTTEAPPDYTLNCGCEGPQFPPVRGSARVLRSGHDETQ